MNILNVMGVTSAGKTSFIEEACKKYTRIGYTSVGKELQKRYPPEYFQGKAALPSTEVEAWQIYIDQVLENSTKDLILGDGQPRLMSSALYPRKLSQAKGWCFRNLYFYSDTDTLQMRTNLRYKRDPANLRLRTERITNDKIQLYDVMGKMLAAGETFDVVDTSDWAIEDMRLFVDTYIPLILANFNMPRYVRYKNLIQDVPGVKL